MFYAKKTVRSENDENRYASDDLLGIANGCVNGCSAGISYRPSSEYDMSHADIHDDQEGMYVIEGTGTAKIGDEEFHIEPDMAFIVPAGTRHYIKRDADSVPVKLFWFHAAI